MRKGRETGNLKLGFGFVDVLYRLRGGFER